MRLNRTVFQWSTEITWNVSHTQKKKKTLTHKATPIHHALTLADTPGAHTLDIQREQLQKKRKKTPT